MSQAEPRIARRADGAFDVDLPSEHRDAIRDLPGQLRELLDAGDARADPALRRLFPTADLDDPEHAAEFDRLVRNDLRAERESAIDAMERTLDADRLSEDEIVAWLAVLNDLRLVLGTRLDVTEDTTSEDFDEDDPRAAAYELYLYLTYLEDEIVGALSAEA